MAEHHFWFQWLLEQKSNFNLIFWIVGRMVGAYNRRKIATEGKAKVIASVWGAEFVQFFAALAVLSRSF